ncbi:hypothetical protein P3T43_001158 [Paraburkholderia sp. GAS41]|uniref:hypothetical protein n=1 Tax=Paraburkholderia sp. GAS41 TaxID=3035134 RepID=UPI003D1E41AE
MFEVLEWLFDISLAVASAAATGSIFLILLELGKVAHKHFVQYRAAASVAINADATS